MTERPAGPSVRAWGWVTFAWGLAFVFVYPLSVWRSFLAMTPDQFGNYLAGVAAPPAFLWLVLGFFQQKAELGLQIEEMRNSVREFQEQTTLQREALESEGRREVIQGLRYELDGLKGKALHVVDALSRSFLMHDKREAVSLIGVGSGVASLYELSEENVFGHISHSLTSAISSSPNKVHRFVELVPDDARKFLDRIEKFELEFQSLNFRILENGESSLVHRLDFCGAAAAVCAMQSVKSVIIDALRGRQ